MNKELVVYEKPLDDKHTLRRVLNEKGEEFFLILDKDGHELIFAPTINEKSLLNNFYSNKDKGDI